MKYRFDGWLLAAMFGALCMPNCDDDGPYWDGDEVDPHCGAFPGDCGGEVGGFCRFPEDCETGVCCRHDECGSGMCTYFCSVPADCPPEMGCRHGYCMFHCSDDRHCAPGQGCHDGLCRYD